MFLRHAAGIEVVQHYLNLAQAETESASDTAVYFGSKPVCGSPRVALD